MPVPAHPFHPWPSPAHRGEELELGYHILLPSMSPSRSRPPLQGRRCGNLATSGHCAGLHSVLISGQADPSLFLWTFLKREVAASNCQEMHSNYKNSPSVGSQPQITRTPGFHFLFFCHSVRKVRMTTNSTLYFLSDNFFSLGPLLPFIVISLRTSFPHKFKKSP